MADGVLHSDTLQIKEENPDFNEVLNISKHRSYNLVTALSNESESDQPFYFESDHVALKGNHDYQALLKTIVILESQRMRAIQDLETLVATERRALEDPLLFVESLQNSAGVDRESEVPTAQIVAEIPVINWEKYSSNGDSLQSSEQWKDTAENSRNAAKSPSSLPLSLVPSSHSKLKSSAALSPLAPTHGNFITSLKPSTLTLTQSSLLVRGRLKRENKPQTYNRLWTDEEQRKLEELLDKYPVEAVEARRWEKIAKELKDRTKQQVASRCQKLFIKRAQLGLPIPGRLPNMATYRRKGRHRHQRNNKFYFRPSTFLTSYTPPVYMSEDDESGGSGGGDFANYSGAIYDFAGSSSGKREQNDRLSGWAAAGTAESSEYSYDINGGHDDDDCNEGYDESADEMLANTEDDVDSRELGRIEGKGPALISEGLVSNHSREGRSNFTSIT